MLAPVKRPERGLDLRDAEQQVAGTLGPVVGSSFPDLPGEGLDFGEWDLPLALDVEGITVGVELSVADQLLDEGTRDAKQLGRLDDAHCLSLHAQSIAHLATVAALVDMN